MIFDYLNMDAVVEGIMGGIIEVSRFVPKNVWEKGDILKILLVGYNGARNTGADVRVEAMVRQFYHVLGSKNIHIGVLTLDALHSSKYFKPPTELIQFSSVFFKDLLRHSSSFHMAVLSEGSCFKSKFANALTTFFFGAAGIMKVQGKPCIAYGSEAGEMDELLKWFVKRYCNKAFIISRTKPSMEVASSLGLEGTLGTDTAWIFPPGPPEWAEESLKKHNWNGNQPVVGAAVINPFYWPVKPDLAKFIRMKLEGKKRKDNYDKWYFFSTSKEREKKFKEYIEAIAEAMDHIVQKLSAFPVIIGMERLDIEPCRLLQDVMKHRAPIFCSEDFDGYELTSILRKLSLLITSRYHARVLSMPAGVPSCAVSMDERLRNLMMETGHLNDYYVETDDPDLKEKLPLMMEKLWEEREKVKDDIQRTIPEYLRRMALMGMEMKKFVSKNFPGLSLPPDSSNIFDYLPPLYPELKEVVEKYG